MPPAKRAKSAKKQPKITHALGTARRVVNSDNSDESDDDEVEEATPARRGPGRPRKDKVVQAPVIFDDNFPLNSFSNTVEKRGGHVPLVWFNSLSDYLDLKTTLHDTSTEVGPKAGHLHIQCVFSAHCHTDDNTIKEIKNLMKAAMGVRWGDGSGCLIHLKPLAESQSVTTMIGYVRKDRNLSTFRNRNKNVTDEMVAAGISAHETLKMSYMDGKIVLTKSNLFQKAFQKWFNEIAPRKMRFSALMTEILNDGNHVLSAHLLMNSNGQMRRTAAEVYWNLLMGNEVTEYEVSHLLYLPKAPHEINMEYIPNELPPANSSALFGSDNEDDEQSADDDRHLFGESSADGQIDGDAN